MRASKQRLTCVSVQRRARVGLTPQTRFVVSQREALLGERTWVAKVAWCHYVQSRNCVRVGIPEEVLLHLQTRDAAGIAIAESDAQLCSSTKALRKHTQKEAVQGSGRHPHAGGGFVIDMKWPPTRTGEARQSARLLACRAF